ncbi:DNA N-glycosylase and apurinic/apyrimidinic (AP) lyase [Lobulomyces angularis]|nr:DNA N-glycosylase and apurinic/apyrimidinic (AP) lyase [Lobulomyces angularis]
MIQIPKLLKFSTKEIEKIKSQNLYVVKNFTDHDEVDEFFIDLKIQISWKKLQSESCYEIYRCKNKDCLGFIFLTLEKKNGSNTYNTYKKKSLFNDHTENCLKNTVSKYFQNQEKTIDNSFSNFPALKKRKRIEIDYEEVKKEQIKDKDNMCSLKTNQNELNFSVIKSPKNVKDENSNQENLKIEEHTTSEKRITIKRKKEKLLAKEPSNWLQLYNLIKEYRKENSNAPVDTMGCSIISKDEKDVKILRYQTLVSLQLSSQTKDAVTYQAMKNLRGHNSGLTVDSILEMDDQLLDSYIGKVGFHNRKTIYLKKTAAVLKEKYAGDIPETVEELMSLPGVGPKMAYLAMQCGWGKSVGIGVDVHVHRICNRLGWVNTKTPEETRLSLESWLPQDNWGEINHILVGFGQLVCFPLRPSCSTCPVKDLCPKIGTKNKT